MQLNVTRVLFLSGFLLITGLVSCSPDKLGPQDDFRISPPTLVFEDQTRSDFKELKVKQANASFAAKIEFGPEVQSQELAVQITTKCRMNDKIDSGLTRQYLGPKTLSLLQLMPDEALLRLPGEKLICSFEFIATNSNRSQHLFSLRDVHLETSAAGQGLDLKQDGTFVKNESRYIQEISLDQIGHFFVVAPNGASKILLNCEQHHLVAQINNQTLVPFNQFDTARAKSISNDNLPLGLYPIQYCRAKVDAGGGQKLISPLLKVTFERSQTTTDWAQDPTIPDINGYLSLGRGLISNHTKHNVTLRIPKPGEQKAMVKKYDQNQVVEYALGLTFLTDKKPNQEGEIVLPPGSNLFLLVHASHKVNCTSQTRSGEFGSVPVNSGVWIWFPKSVGPEWIQTSDAKHFAAHKNISSGPWPIFLQDSNFSLINKTVSGKPLDADAIKKIPLDQNSYCRQTP